MSKGLWGHVDLMGIRAITALVHDHDRDRFPVGGVMHRHAGPASQSVLVIIGGKTIDGSVEIRIVTPDRIGAVTGSGGKDEIGVPSANACIGGRRIGGTIFGGGDDLGS